jgi:prepilin peptidase CpaA
MSLDWPRLLSAAVFAILLLVAAIYDIRDRRIPNWTVLALLAAFLVAASLRLTPDGWLSSLTAFGIAFVGSGLLYMFGVLGAGDSKLFSATALFLGLKNLALLASVTTLAGGLLALGFLILRPKSAAHGLTGLGRAEEGKTGIPYGVAIAVGGWTTAVLIRFLWPHYHFTHYDPNALKI